MSTRETMPIQATLAIALAACLAFSLRAGSNYYVDANNGDDAWDGSTAALPSAEQLLLSPVPGPRKTLAGAMAIPGLTSGDTVHAAPGVYNEGGMENSAGSNRVIVADGVLLVGDQGASVTTIEGKISDEAGNRYGCASDSMRAVYLNGTAVLKGFTVTKGRPTKVSGSDNNGNGGGVYGGLVVECVFSNNVASFRGNAASGSAELLRCYVGNDPSESYSCYAGVHLIDCVHDTSKNAYSSIRAYNTTFVRGYPYQWSHIYNCLFLSGHGSASQPATLYNCISTSAQSTATAGDENNQYSVAKADIGYDTTTYRPLSGSLAVDAGNDAYYALATNGWTGTKLWWQTFITGKDYAGGEGSGGARRLGSAIDVGAGEYDPSVRKLTITDAQTALVVTGADKGTTMLSWGQTNTFTLSRGYSTTKLLTGVTVNGEFFSFTGENADRTYEYVYGYGDPVESLSIEAVYADHNDWYVNPNVDPANGPVGDDANDGYTKYRPKRTLAGAMSNALVASGDTVHAAAGVYNEGTMAMSPTSTETNRVVVKAGVGLVADEGREVTAIEGFIPESAKRGTTDPIRCVYMESGAYLKGFTLRNGMASMWQETGTVYGNYGGGVCGGTTIDCVISNCFAVRGGGAGSTTLIRCKLINNRCIDNQTKNPAGGTANVTAAGLYYGNGVYDSIIGDAATAPGKVVNSTVNSLTHNNGSSGSRVYVYNCYIENDGGWLILTNSIVRWGIKSSSHCGAGSLDLSTLSSPPPALKFDENGRPDITDPTTAQYAIDKGDRTYYKYPSAFAHEAGKDFAGGQRIYNGQIDIGPGEYDRRGDFTQALTKKPDQLAVDVATPDVVTNALGQVSLSNGDSLKLALTLPVGGILSFSLDNAEGVTVTVDGAAVAAAGSTYSFQAEAGEHTVVIEYEGASQAAITECLLPRRGMLLIIQ
ncbi:MAG: hypothetical protein IJI35_15390 [Kiritimatiellae bacterium]|nr:hypothetical protein [Kiritimatiellia bacterium]